ncbi:MAG: beta-galactosidase trimerization domain-containing protein, partial [Cyclobacteriaceae bacterium]|nr:beta-galactosidase trimerization domain-containing protein [Cyclobacteriaceae bacterium]
QHGMSTSRIRLFEDHINKEGEWNYEMYDFAFDMAAKYNIKLLVTLFPSDNSVGGFKFPRDEKHLVEIGEYIKNVVLHFRDHPAMDCWVLQNEPGVDERFKEGLAEVKYQAWLSDKQKNNSSNWEHINWELFFRDYTTWYIQWIGSQIELYDKNNLTHINNHQLFNNLPQYDFKNWLPSLSTLGVSIHASWHLRAFERSQYTMAIAAHCDIIRQASLPKPFWVTELQGGNNIFSGFNPMSVYAKDIAQWVWTSIMCGAERVIFWTLNPRGKGHETGEWGMITYQDEPTERLLMSKKIAGVISENNHFFKNAKPLKPEITLLYSIESMITLETVMSNKFDDNYKGRKQGAHILSLLSYYETLLELGVSCEIKDINEFNWTETSPGHTVILANMVALSSDMIKSIYEFVENGNKLIMTGMTGFFDENMQNVYQQKSPFTKLTGADLRGFDFVGEHDEIEIDGFKLPVHMLVGELKNYSAKIISKAGKKITGVRNKYGRGTATWIPSLIGLGSWQNDNSPLADFLQNELSRSFDRLPFFFEKHMPGVLMKTLASKNNYVSMVVNNNTQTVEVPISIQINKKPIIIFGESKQMGNKIIVDSGDTVIIWWG